MCGIVGYVGTNNVPNREYFALDVVLEGLRRLEYRGYDSAGVAMLEGGKINFRKKAGKVAGLDEEIARDPLPDSVVGIGHPPTPTLTRTWVTAENSPLSITALSKTSLS